MDGLEGHCACGGACADCAAAASSGGLPIGPPDDAFEREADEVADRVSAGLEVGSLGAVAAPVVQRACACGGSMEADGQECAECQAERLSLERKADRATSQAIAPPIVHDALASRGRPPGEAVPASVYDLLHRGGGWPLENPLRDQMQREFGRRLDSVRIHVDAEAARAAEEVNAHAFTVGHNIVFGANRYEPTAPEGARLLRHELVHVVQQDGRSAAGESLVVGSSGGEAEREAAAGASLAASATPPVVQVRAASGTLQREAAPAEERSLFSVERDEGETPPSTPTPAATPIGVCGPRVTTQFRRALRNIESTFGSWPRRTQLRACARVLIPVTPDLQPDINGWDTLPLFQGASRWLRRPPVYVASRRGPCATPTSSDPGNRDDFAPGHEDPATCSNTVQFESGCWLNGTVNYATFGVMVRLCEGQFALADIVQAAGPELGVPGEIIDAVQLFLLLRSPSLIEWAELLISAYKAAKGSGVDTADLPIAWVRAFYSGGSSSAPPGSPNRPRCRPACRLDGSSVHWDWVWEPVKPRSRATHP